MDGSHGIFLKSDDPGGQHEKDQREAYLKKRTVLEFCCDEDSEIGNTAEEHNSRSIRFTQGMDTAVGREEVISHLEDTENPVRVVSLPCTP